MNPFNPVKSAPARTFSVRCFDVVVRSMVDAAEVAASTASRLGWREIGSLTLAAPAARNARRMSLRPRPNLPAIVGVDRANPRPTPGEPAAPRTTRQPAVNQGLSRPSAPLPPGA